MSCSLALSRVAVFHARSRAAPREATNRCPARGTLHLRWEVTRTAWDRVLCRPRRWRTVTPGMAPCLLARSPVILGSVLGARQTFHCQNRCAAYLATPSLAMAKHANCAEAMRSITSQTRRTVLWVWREYAHCDRARGTETPRMTAVGVCRPTSPFSGIRLVP